ncbi:MAG: lipocalin family protein [bacterium]
MARWTWLILIAALAIPCGAGSDPGWRRAAPGYRWEWPRDHYAHPEFKTEWWYFTGHLEPEDDAGIPGDTLGFQLTFFRLGMVPPGTGTPEAGLAARGGIMAHAAISDATAGDHLFSEVLWRATPLLGGFGAPGDTVIAWCRGPGGTADLWSLGFDGQAFALRASDERRGLAFDLRCRPVKPVVLHGDQGFSAKNAAGTAGSLYAAFTRMEVSGSVMRNEAMIHVRGECWMDQEIFTSTLAPDQKGWDWVSLQLADGRELMVYRLFGPEGGEGFGSGTLVAPDGSTTPLAAGEFRLEPRDRWRSPVTGAEYPVSWILEVPSAGLDLDLQAVLPDQENVSRLSGVHYWEGAVTVRSRGPAGATVGRGYVEMAGYGEGNRPPV